VLYPEFATCKSKKRNKKGEKPLQTLDEMSVHGAEFF